MFNLIVAGSGWRGNRDVFPRNRVLEYTDEEIANRFAPNKVLDTDLVSALPTIFMPENGVGSELARVGTVIRIKSIGADYQLDYTFDSEIPPIPNAKIMELADELNIDRWEFSRTHWAIKDVDLFRVLLHTSTSVKAAPRVFHLPDEPINPNLVAVMMPFDAQFNQVYSSLRAAVSEAGLTCERADDIWKYDAVIDDIVSLIGTSTAVICDLSGRNSNVFYEAGIAHTLGKDVILITQSKDDVPFNLRHLRFVPYLNNGEGLKRLQSDVAKRLRTLTT